MTTIEIRSDFAPATPSAQIPSYDSIVADLLEVIRAQTKDTGANWSVASTLQETGIDSFDFVELVFEVEDKYSVDLNFNANKSEDLKTVGDVAKLIQTRIIATRGAK